MDNYIFLVKRAIKVLRIEKLLSKDTETKQMVEILYRRQNQKTIFEEIWCRRILVLVLVLCASVLFFLACLLQEPPEDVIVDKNHLRINGEEEATFFVEAGEGEKKAQDEITVQREEEVWEEKIEKEPDEREVLLDEIREAVTQAVSAEEGQDSEGRIALPENVSGMDVTYRNPEYKKDFSPVLLCVFVLCVLPFLWKKKRQELLQEREKQLLLDYPELVNKIMLLLGAGLTVRGCLERICIEYQRHMTEGGMRKYVYEEICFSYQEIKNGVSEAGAIEAFGKRCALVPYLRFSSLLTQNLKKGSDGLIHLLEIEAAEAFGKRKEQIKMLGETAGTKLLFPMILMLGVVMVIIIVPAFMTM